MLAANALGNIGSHESIDALEKCMSDESKEVRDSCSWAIKVIKLKNK